MDAILHATITEHLALQRLSLRQTPMNSTVFSIGVGSIRSPSCSTSTHMLQALGNTVGEQWCTLIMQNQACKHVVNIPSSAHQILLLAEEELGPMAEELAPYARPTCRACSSRLLVVHSRERASLENTLARLLDGDIRWMLVREVQESADRAWFALRQQPLPLRVQQHLQAQNTIQTSLLPCEAQKFLIHTLGGSGLGAVMSTDRKSVV